MVEKAPQSLQAKLYRRYEHSPQGRALAFYEPSGKYTWRSYAELYEAGLSRAKALSAKGLRPGEVCILIPENDEFSTTNLMAVLILGAIPVLSAPPIVRGHHSNLKAVLRYLLRKTQARMVITSIHLEALLEELPKTHNKVQFIFGEAKLGNDSATADKVCHFPDPGTVVAMQLTSGTTGFPKICVWNHTRVLAALDGMVEGMGTTKNDVFVNWTPLYHDMGLVNNFLFCMVQDIPLVMMSTFEFVKNPVIWLKALTDVGATMTWSPNFGYAIAANWVRDDQLEGVRLDRVRAFWNAAERIHLETIETFHRRFSGHGVSMQALKTNFGMAENVGGATFSDPQGMFAVEHLNADTLFKHGKAMVVQRSDSGPSKTVTAVGVGRPYPGLELKIISRKHRALGDGEVGEVAFVSPSRMLGYLSNAKETKKAIKGELLRTGDLGYQRNGELFWLGRLKERINLNGKKYDPSDFEKALLGVEGLRKGCFAVFGVDDEQAGTQRLIIVAEKRDTSPVPEQTIMRNIAGSINRQLGVKVSEAILLGEGSMTKTSSGKRRHRYYHELYTNGKLEPVAQSRL
ncbi:MAG: AMP-binding protein [Pseudomonadota bacterium]